MSRQGSATLGVGVHRFLGLPLTLPVDRMVAELNRFKLQMVVAHPRAHERSLK